MCILPKTSTCVSPILCKAEHVHTLEGQTWLQQRALSNDFV